MDALGDPGTPVSPFKDLKFNGNPEIARLASALPIELPKSWNCIDSLGKRYLYVPSLAGRAAVHPLRQMWWSWHWRGSCKMYRPRIVLPNDGTLREFGLQSWQRNRRIPSGVVSPKVGGALYVRNDVRPLFLGIRDWAISLKCWLAGVFGLWESRATLRLKYKVWLKLKRFVFNYRLHIAPS